MRTTLAALLLALPLAVPARGADPLSMVPPDATAVGMVRVADLRSSPYAARLFSETDHVTIDGDAARFLAEARLNPTEDVDTIVFAATAGRNGRKSSGLAIFEGRFDADSVSAALVSRGAVKVSSADGALLLLPDKGEADHKGAIAFLDRHVAVAGSRESVEGALAQRAARTDFRTGAGLGRHLRRVATDASAWVLVDVSKSPLRDRHPRIEGELHSDGHKVDVHVESQGSQVMQIAGVMKQVPLLAMSATMKRDGMKLQAFGLCEDAETRGLLEDSLRGLLAAWRLAVQESKPDLVPVLRAFKVEQAKDGVTLTGTVPGAMLASFLEKKSLH